MDRGHCFGGMALGEGEVLAPLREMPLGSSVTFGLETGRAAVRVTAGRSVVVAAMNSEEAVIRVEGTETVVVVGCP